MTLQHHWIDYQFKVKLSVMKMLTPSNVEVVFSYVYYAMECIEYIPKVHYRQWISTYSMFEIEYTCIEEQKKIADFLTSIDNEIENYTKTLEQLEQLKKGLMQRMFM